MSREIKRCNWPKDDALYIEYHDKEWGVPVCEDAKIRLFYLVLMALPHLIIALPIGAIDVTGAQYETKT